MNDIFQVSQFADWHFIGSLLKSFSSSVLPQEEVRRLPQGPQGSHRVPHVRDDGVSEGRLLQDRSKWRR